MADLNLLIRNDSETLWLARRCRQLTQRDMAKLLKVPYKTYFRCENGQAKWPKDLPTVTGCRPGDLCALARRRHGLTLLKTAQLLKCSHSTLLTRERTSDVDLVNAWRYLGYSF